jgi:hypothetical protein
MSQAPTTLPMAAAPPPTASASAPAGFDLEKVAAALDDANARRSELDPLPRQVLDETLESLNAVHKGAALRAR